MFPVLKLSGQPRLSLMGFTKVSFYDWLFCSFGRNDAILHGSVLLFSQSSSAYASLDQLLDFAGEICELYVLH